MKINVVERNHRVRIIMNTNPVKLMSLTLEEARALFFDFNERFNHSPRGKHLVAIQGRSYLFNPRASQYLWEALYCWYQPQMLDDFDAMEPDQETLEALDELAAELEKHDDQ